LANKELRAGRLSLSQAAHAMRHRGRHDCLVGASPSIAVAHLVVFTVEISAVIHTMILERN